jgi:hypothetical protein
LFASLLLGQEVTGFGLLMYSSKFSLSSLFENFDSSQPARVAVHSRAKS